jgi:ABC-type multidrug transport system fused ATPase/permease subunit
VLIVAIVAIYWVALIIPIMLYLQLKLYKFAINAYRETTRLESVSKSPLLSFLAETCNGASTIRAFGK